MWLVTCILKSLRGTNIRSCRPAPIFDSPRKGAAPDITLRGNLISTEKGKMKKGLKMRNEERREEEGRDGGGRGGESRGEWREYLG